MPPDRYRQTNIFRRVGEPIGDPPAPVETRLAVNDTGPEDFLQVNDSGPADYLLGVD